MSATKQLVEALSFGEWVDYDGALKAEIKRACQLAIRMDNDRDFMPHLRGEEREEAIVFHAAESVELPDDIPDSANEAVWDHIEKAIQMVV